MNVLKETIKLTSNVSANYLILMKLLWGFKQIDEKYMTLIHSYLMFSLQWLKATGCAHIYTKRVK